MTRYWIVVTVGLVGCGLALAAGDDFNRANSTNMGPNWNEVAGDWRIESNHARSSPGFGNTDMMIWTPGSPADTTVKADVFYGGSARVTYAALVARYASTSNCLFVKVQDNNSNGDFERVFFYWGNNGSAWAGMTGGSSYVDVAPFTSANIWIITAGSDVTLNIDRDFNGIPEDTLTRGGMPAGGTDVGLGGFDNADLDNFDIPGPGKICDDFNRANSTNMGPNWNEVAGDWRIQSNHARSSLGPSTDMMIWTLGSPADTVVEADVYYTGSARVMYNALVARYASTSNCLFVKVQDNNSNGDFERVFFYWGNNGSPWAGMTGGSYYLDVTPPFKSARIWIVVAGGNVTLNIDRDFNGIPEDTIARGGMPGGGTDVGLGGYNDADFDDFCTVGGLPKPCPGDFNCDGKRDFDDIDVFVAVLGGKACPCPNPANCDPNGDGKTTFDDIDPFITLLGVPCPKSDGDGPPPVLEPRTEGVDVSLVP